MLRVATTRGRETRSLTERTRRMRKRTTMVMASLTALPSPAVNRSKWVAGVAEVVKCASVLNRRIMTLLESNPAQASATRTMVEEEEVGAAVATIEAEEGAEVVEAATVTISTNRTTTIVVEVNAAVATRATRTMAEVATKAVEATRTMEEVVVAIIAVAGIKAGKDQLEIH